MSLQLLDLDWDELWQEDGGATASSASVEQLCTFAGQLGRGSEQQIPLRNGLHLTVSDYELWEDVTISSQHSSETYLGNICISFVVSGSVRTIHHGLTDYVLELPGKNYLEFVPGGRETEDWAADNRIVKVRVGIQSEALRQMSGEAASALPKELQLFVEHQESSPYYRMETTTLEMHHVLQQILNCPYQNWTRQFYLESKALELLLLWLSQTNGAEGSQSCKLSPADINCIHQAKDILVHRLHQPPSLLELARQVGLNDRKLKQGFRQVFGTTVFGYLHDYRMQQAHQLLSAGQTNVKETAQRVGYASQSAFNAAFKKRFGLNPKALQQRR
jgi:AraC family transcriptional regulator, transcriptional activator of the genes for pyochelin and ferripyochelin receptors